MGDDKGSGDIEYQISHPRDVHLLACYPMAESGRGTPWWRLIIALLPCGSKRSDFGGKFSTSFHRVNAIRRPTDQK